MRNAFHLYDPGTPHAQNTFSRIKRSLNKNLSRITDLVIFTIGNQFNVSLFHARA